MAPSKYLVHLKIKVVSRLKQKRLKNLKVVEFKQRKKTNWKSVFFNLVKSEYLQNRHLLSNFEQVKVGRRTKVAADVFAFLKNYKLV